MVNKLGVLIIDFGDDYKIEFDTIGLSLKKYGYDILYEEGNEYQKGIMKDSLSYFRLDFNNKSKFVKEEIIYDVYKFNLDENNILRMFKKYKILRKNGEYIINEVIKSNVKYLINIVDKLRNDYPEYFV